MALVFESRSRVSGNPSDYGVKDWHHNAEGKVDYPWYKANKPLDEIDWGDNDVPLDEQHWSEDCSDEALDNLMYGRHIYAARCDGFDEWERNERMFN